MQLSGLHIKPTTLEKKRIAILGSTGSIGTQALKVIQEQERYFSVEVLTAQDNVALLIQQAKTHKPNVVVIGNDKHYQQLFQVLDPLDIKVYAGQQAISQVLEMDSIDLVLMAIVGFAGLQPTLSAITHKKRLALANKESLVIAGELVTKRALENHTTIIPVDSEHSAIFQCLMGEFNNPIEKIVLTASGGPFRGMPFDKLVKVSAADALKHPNWHMGEKVTIDSASLMNKGLEAIEAKWLFDLRPDQIEVVIHPESIIHSFVYFNDSSVKAQLGLPNMQVPIQFALTYPDRLSNQLERLDLSKLGSLNFAAPDMKIFRNLALAFEVMEKGGNQACILNASNEIAVEAFLKGAISFTNIPTIVEESMQAVAFIQHPTLDDYVETDRLSRIKAKEIINRID